MMYLLLYVTQPATCQESKSGSSPAVTANCCRIYEPQTYIVIKILVFKIGLQKAKGICRCSGLQQVHNSGYVEVGLAAEYRQNNYGYKPGGKWKGKECYTCSRKVGYTFCYFLIILSKESNKLNTVID